MIIVQPAGVRVQSAELDKRCKLITEHLVAIMDALSITMDSGKFPKDFFKFLANISEDDSVLPNNFLSGFEIGRLTFDMFANLKNMNEWKSKMILSTFLLIKGLLYFLIMRSWTVISSIPQKNVNIKNIINVGSIFYHVVLEIFMEHISEIEDDGETEPPFKAKPPAFSALDPGEINKLDVIPDDNDDDEQEIISGFYNRDRLISYLDDRPSITNEFKEAVVDFLDVVYEHSHAAYEPKAHVKKMFEAHRPKK